MADSVTLAGQLAQAGVNDAIRNAADAMRLFGQAIRRVGLAWQETWAGVLEQQTVLDDFIAHGGDPAFVLRVERAYGVTHDFEGESLA